MNERKCGGCTLCCRIAMPGSPHGQLCKHAEPGCGCKIYSKRPQFCADFGCAWSESITQIRPDELGAFFAAPSTCSIQCFYETPTDLNGELFQEELARACNAILDLHGQDTLKVHLVPLAANVKVHHMFTYRRRR